LADEIRSYAAGLDTDPAALELVQERLAEVARLERKFKRTDSELAEMLQSATLELQGLSDLPDRKRLDSDLLVAETEMKRCAEVLSKRRGDAAKKLSKQVEAELSELSMEARFLAQLEPIAWGEQGAEKVELLISANKGLKPLPLRQIASGGELSRITLVLKKILQERTGVNVLVFDEVDTGISGGVARAVGEKLKALSQNSQVICITHLPQVASLADRHILVEKGKGKQGFAHARELDAEERVEEIARMLAGYEVTAAARASARELVSSKIL
jgi:DNA repair protein RecN (Recombination protein N)